MRQQCPECLTVTGGQAAYCEACGHSYGRDKVREMAIRSRQDWRVAVLMGLAVALVQFWLSR